MAEPGLRRGLERSAKNQGADLFGVADLTPVQDFVRSQGGESLIRFPRAISVGIRLLDTVVDQLPRHDDPYAIYAYMALYTSMNARLDWITLSLARRMREKGFEAYQIPASQP